jgi:hypothetical protein
MYSGTLSELPEGGSAEVVDVRVLEVSSAEDLGVGVFVGSSVVVVFVAGS